ncbi:MAG: amino acid permease [Flavobacteriaceae bacterium]|nr:amino acid permease [Flavobacteriaceae bacterium]
MKKLQRSLNLSSVIAISIGGMLGSGIFVLPGLAAAKTGSSVWLAYLLAAVCILPAALSKSELATAMPTSGGTYVYIERAFGPILGTISGIGLWLSLLLKSSFALVGFGAYLSVLIDIDLGYIKYIAIFFLGLIMLLNIYGVKKVGKVQLIVVTFSLTGLISLLFFGLPQVTPTLLDPFFLKGNYGLVTTIAFVYISYAGVTKVAAIAGEIKNPSKNIPTAMILSLIIMSMLYVSIAFMLVGNIPLDELAIDLKPIYSLAFLLGGKYIGYAAAVLGVVTLVSMANSGVLAASRFPFAMSRDKLFPEFMSKIHPTKLTPVVTIVVTCLLMALAILFLDVVRIAKLASAFMVMSFMLVNLCVIVLRETSVQWYEPTYKSPLYPFMQLFGVISGAVLLVFLGMIPLLAVFGLIVLGIAVYYIYGTKADRTGVLKLYGHRPASYLLYKKEKASRKVRKKKLSINPKFLDGNFDAEEEGVVIPLLGNENSPEMLVEMGAALNKRSKILAVDIKEVPNQTLLDAVLQDSPRVNSLARRLTGLAKNRNIDIDFEAVATHEISDTIHELSDKTHCDWLVMGWNGRANNGMLIGNPIGWLIANINSDFALFKDNGVRNIGRVLLALRSGRKDKNFVAIVDRICKFYNASFTLLHVIPEDSSEEEILNIEKTSQNIISKASALCDLKIVKSNNPIEAISTISADYDLLVLGTPEKYNWRNVLFGAGKDEIANNSACSVLRLTVRD